MHPANPSSRVDISDSGVLHTLLGIRIHDDLERHPKVGASWESFGISQVVDHLRAGWHECYFWRTHAGAELDLLIVRGRMRRGFECKRTPTPAGRRRLPGLMQTRPGAWPGGKRPDLAPDRLAPFPNPAIPPGFLARLTRPIDHVSSD